MIIYSSPMFEGKLKFKKVKFGDKVIGMCFVDAFVYKVELVQNIVNRGKKAKN
jgi:hypothetical protein